MNEQQLIDSIAYFDGVGQIIGLESYEGNMIWGTKSHFYDARTLSPFEIQDILNMGIEEYNKEIAMQP